MRGRKIACAMGFVSESFVAREHSMALAKDPEFVTVEMHRVVPLVEVLDHEIDGFDASVFDQELGFLIIVLSVYAIRGLRVAFILEYRNTPVEGWRREIGAEGGGIEEASL